MANLERLLGYGMLPKELPPPFHSESYAETVANQSDFSQLESTHRSAKLGNHELARPGQLSRTLGIVNPIQFYDLAETIAKEWVLIEEILKRESFSVSKPVPADDGEQRAISQETEWGERAELRTRHRADARYLLQADIQKFYPNLYTHSIPWGMHSKQDAKEIRDDSLLGNKLDDLVRPIQDDQTTGIPIGPETSLILAELVLSGVDVNLRCRTPSLRGFRAVDDYEILQNSRAECEEALAILREQLARYELKLNPSKTTILELPVPVDTEWPHSLRQFEFGNQDVVSSVRSVIDYFNVAFDLSNKHPNDSVLKYAIKRSREVSFKGDAWDTYHNLILQCATAERGTLPVVLQELKRYRSVGRDINYDRLQSVISTIVNRHAPMNHGSEVAWAMWASIDLGIPLTSEATRSLQRIEDPVVSVLALHAEDIGLAEGLNKDRWLDRMTTSDLYGPDWLVAYEADLKNWLPSKGEGSHVDSDPCFSFLKDKGVSFFNPGTSEERTTRRRTSVYALSA